MLANFLLALECHQDLKKRDISRHRQALHLFIGKLVEDELDEVAEVLSQLKSNKANTDDASLENELADVVHYVVEIANVNGIDLGKAIIEKDKRASVKYNESPNLAEFLSKN
jgi:NTP pyrophosphatase (non-canonical NTP hydrolase)